MPQRRRLHGSTLAGLLNSSARSDDEARRRASGLFGSLLVGLWLADVGGALATVVGSCAADEEDGAWTDCVGRSLARWGLFRTHARNSEDHHHHGDFLVLALLRGVTTGVLLFVGVRWGRRAKPSDEATNHLNDSSEGSTQPSSSSSSPTSSLAEPLLWNQEAEALEVEEVDSVERQANAPSSSRRPRRRCIPCGSSSNGTPETSINCVRRLGQRLQSPEYVKNLVLVTLFVLSSLYQVYAGLRVAVAEEPTPPHHHYYLTTTLMCLTVLWINAEASVFRTLLAELTREEGLFLPPEVHRHPVFYEKSRAMSMHFCDLCRRRIQADDGGCYRCALCDFDVCLHCAQRTDAATVGENVLRGDRGVRAEASLSTMAYVRRAVAIARSELFLLLVSFALLAAGTLSRLFLPHFQGHIIDKVIPDADTGHYDKDGFLRTIRHYVYLMLLQGALSTLYSALFTLVSRRLKFTIRNALLEKILVQDVAYFDGTESGRLISRLTNDLDLMMAPIQSSLSSLLSNVLTLVGGMVMCFIKSYRLSMLAFVTVGPITYLWEQYALWSKGLAREMLSYWAEGNSIASQALSHVRTVKAFGCEETVTAQYSEANRRALHCGVKDAWGNGVTSALTGYLDLGSGVLILYFGGLLVYRKEMSVGELVTFQLFWNMMNNSYQSLQGLITSFTRSAAGAEKIFSLWDSHPDIDPSVGEEVSSSEVQGHLRLSDVSFYYQMRPDNLVLDRFNLDIPAGKTVALVGRSGGGKSTIINLLLRFYDPKSGQITLDGRPYESFKVNHLRRLYGVVTQETELFALTVEENIAYGLRKDEYELRDVVEAAKRAYAHDFIVDMKDGYQTRIGERGNRLSGGQRQRLAIARVFLRRPRIILLDEATSALDEGSQEAVQKALAKLMEESGATVVLVAHRLSTVVNADSICVVDKGTVLEQGNHQELVAKGGVYASLVEKQNKKRVDLLDQDNDDNGGQEKEGKEKKAMDDIDTLLGDA